MSENEQTPVTESNPLENLGIKLVEQTSLEQKIQANANQLISQQEIELDLKRLDKAKDQLNKFKYELRKLQDRLNNPRTRISQKEELREQIQIMESERINPTLIDIQDIEERLASHKKNSIDSDNNTEGGRLPNESEKDYLIRTGKITAFGNTTGFVTQEDDIHHEPEQSISHQNLRVPGFIPENDNDAADDNDFQNDNSDHEETDEEDWRPKKKLKLLSEDDIRNTDDGDEVFYQNRLNTWVHNRSSLRSNESQNDDETPEWFKTHPKNPDAVLNNEFKIPGDIYPSLFDYQKTGVQWLYELYSQKHGGIVSDEMGLGKTIQIIAFIAGLHYSGKLDKPVLIVCPATVMTQWVNEFHTWWPPLRTMVLHSIGTGMAGKLKDEDFDKALLLEGDEDANTAKTLQSMKSNAKAQAIMNTLLKKGHVLITSYVGLRIYEDHLLNVDWGYVVLDEGHKIKNPNSNITILSKRLKTYNRIILSGTPIQNNLIELWSLFDFIFPGRLGTLPIFEEEFETPIKMGGYANASNIQVKIGYQKAVVLKELIQPFLLRRMKVDVAKDLPLKQEYVLMCRLTKYQKEQYLQFLKSVEFKVNSYLGAIDTLRKICNHPDLADVHYKENTPGYGDPIRSGKLLVLKPLLLQWKKEKHKVLLFTQTKQMMVILEKFLKKTMGPDFRYMKMSGETGIGKRQDMIFSFNNEDYDLFLLTTKVGGLGVNLTGADRVIIFDPDWNPSTDLQARERAWRLGQKKEVLIYRLVIGGSIEEKIYHRQIFKQLLTDKILKDPNQKRFFKNSELHDLFTLSDFDTTTETNFGTVTKKENDDLNKISKLQGVTGLKEYEDQTEKQSEDDRLLGGLFKKSSAMAQAVKHDDIVDQHSKPKEDLIDREARQVANNALEALKRSRQQVKRAGLGVPTFTGRFGAAGKPGSRLGMKSKMQSTASSSILKNLKAKKNNEDTQKFTDGKHIKMINDMRDYLSNKEDHFASSSDILDACQIEIIEKKDLSMIRTMLKGIATWDKQKSGWVLLDEYN